MNNKDQLLTDWRKADAELKELRKRESELRKQVIEAFSEVGPEHSGVERVDIGWNHDLKITHKLDYKLDSAADYSRVDDAEIAIVDLVGEELGDVMVSRLFKRKFDISVSEYKKLLELPKGAQIKAIVDKILTIKPGSPSVEIVKQ